MTRTNNDPGLKVEYVRPWLYPAQQEAIFDCRDPDGKAARYAFIEASTKAGKTVGCIAWLFEQATKGGPGDHYWWVAPVYNQTKIAFRRLKRYLPASLFKANESELFITLANGATIWFKSAEKPDNLYGEDVKAAVLDEASRMREDAWTAIRSTLTATRGPIRCIGNVKGRRNWFYRLARRAEAGEKRMAFSKLTAYDAADGGVIAKSEIEDAKATLPDDVFRELYLAEASDDQGNPFGYAKIKACVRPLSELPPVAFGIDLAKSVDWTVIIALDRYGHVCGYERFQKSWEDTVDTICDLIGATPALIDSTGVGDPIVESVQRRMYEAEGFKFTSTSKQRIMEGLRLSIHQESIGYPDNTIRQELEDFEYVYTRTGVRYSAPEGFHDDCVCALALANEMYRRSFDSIDATGPEDLTRVSPVMGG